ncbi:hypothetical protein Trco_001826 [Trichoderma cornu-damae]|uniref:Uncharacterized protein n=1 Tax=Trichoderma cornu-damae TaxID=654480 RepID=A0A9P8QLG5_9HYPO|nr:hypothetical protein Trco_001826 [Trichoderma cornu-damae]
MTQTASRQKSLDEPGTNRRRALKYEIGSILLLFLGEIDVRGHNDLSRLDDDVGGVNGVFLFQFGVGIGIGFQIRGVSLFAAARILWLGFACGSLWGLLLGLPTTKDGIGLPQIFGGPPVNGKAAFKIVDEERRAEHQRTAQQHDGDEEPSDLDEGRIDHGQQGRRASRRMYRFRQRHDGRGRGAGQGATKPFDVFEMITEQEKLGHAAADDGGEDLSPEGISRLRQRRFNGIKFKDSGGALKRTPNIG